MNDADSQTGWAYVTPLRRERIEAGVEALIRINRKRDFHDWYLVGLALHDLREAAREQSGADTGKGYNRAYAQCIADNPKLKPLSEIDDATRSNAVWLAQNWDVVSKWHEELQTHSRRLINHPAAVRHRYNLEHPQPPKPRAKPAGKPEATPSQDEPEEDIEETESESVEDIEVFAFDGDGHIAPPATIPPIEPEDEPETVEALIAAFDALWLRMPPEVRDEVVKRILAWRQETVERVAASDPSDRTMMDATVAETHRAVNKKDGTKVRAMARRKAMTRLSGKPTEERVAIAVEEALADTSNVIKWPDDAPGTGARRGPPTSH